MFKFEEGVKEIDDKLKGGFEFYSKFKQWELIIVYSWVFVGMELVMYLDIIQMFMVIMICSIEIFYYRNCVY